MGLIRAKVTLGNPSNGNLKPVDVTALVDTGATHLCIPQHVAIQLKLKELDKREVTTADGKQHICSYVGPIEVRFENRACYTGALVLGDEVLLGAVPMDDLDIIVSPSRQTVIVNPQSPNIPSAVVKTVEYSDIKT